MKNIFIFIFFCAAITMRAQAPNYVWANGCTSSGVGLVRVAVDDARDAVYTTGYFDFGRIKFSATYDLPSANSGKSMFIAKYSLSGVLQWAKVFAGPNKDCLANGIAVDKQSGNVYVTGNNGSNAGSIRKPDTIHFGSQVFIDHNMSMNAFLVKIDPNGTPLWVKGGFGIGDSSAVNSNAVAVDAQGNPYITGAFFFKAQFGSFNLVRGDHWDDIFIAKYDANGNEIWAKQSIGSGFRGNMGNAINIDKLGNIIVAGSENDDPVSPTPSRILLKLDASGAFKWIKTDGIWQARTDGTSVSTDNSQNIYISGPKAVATVSSVNTAYKTVWYISKFSTLGDSLWSVVLDSTIHAGVDFRTIADSVGNVYALFALAGYNGYKYTFGTYTDSLHFNSVIGLGIVTVHVKYNTNGTVLWGKSTKPNAGQFGFNMCQGFDLNLDKAGNIYTGGRFQDTAYFDNLKAFGGMGTYGLFTTKLGTNAIGINLNHGYNNLFSMYPNPAANSITIQYTAYNPESAYISIVDMRGNSLMKQKIGSKQTNIDIDRLPDGMYMVLVNDGKISGTQKLIVRH